MSEVTEVLDKVKETSHTARLAGMETDEFERDLDRRWQFAASLKDHVKAGVREGQIEPIDGGRLVACITGQMFGYAEFHGLTAPADGIVGALAERLRYPTRELP